MEVAGDNLFLCLFLHVLFKIVYPFITYLSNLQCNIFTLKEFSYKFPCNETERERECMGTTFLHYLVC